MPKKTSSTSSQAKKPTSKTRISPQKSNWRSQTKQCLQCKTEFGPKPTTKPGEWVKQLCCSTACRDKWRKASPDWKEARRETATAHYRKTVADYAPDPPVETPTDPRLVDPRLAALAKELASRTLARRSLLHFTRKTHPSYSAGWVHDDICRRLQRFSQQVAERKSPRLMLLMPPRHGKSELASIRFPAWHLGHFPQHELINVGYNLDLPMKFSRKVRELFRDPLYRAIFPQAMLDPDVSAAEGWSTTMGGGFTAAGVGGGITGKGAHVLIVDDPIKNMQEADSATTRETLWDWYLSTAYTRLAPGGGVLVIETWWNDDDLAGRLQQAMKSDPEADQFEIVKYPALAEAYEYRNKETLQIVRFPPQADTGASFPAPDDAILPDEAAMAGRAARAKLLGAAPGSDTPVDCGPWELLRTPGEALHRARYDEPALTRIRAVQEPRIWSALYQQNPIPDEGLYFRKEYFRTAPVIPQPYGMRVLTAWDFAIGEKQQNDYTVGATLLQDHDDQLYVIDVVRFRGDSFLIVETILNTYMRHWQQRTDIDYRLGFEDGQIWKSIRPLLEKRMQERKLYPSYEILRPLTDKLARARSLQGRMQQGRVWFPENASWRPETEHELLRFPGGVHDDIVDALAWAVNLVVGKAPPRRIVPAALKSWRDRMEDSNYIGDGTHMVA